MQHCGDLADAVLPVMEEAAASGSDGPKPARFCSAHLQTSQSWPMSLRSGVSQDWIRLTRKERFDLKFHSILGSACV